MMVPMIEGQETKWPGKVQEKASEVQLLFCLTTGVLFTRSNLSIHSFRSKTKQIKGKFKKEIQDFIGHCCEIVRLIEMNDYQPLANIANFLCLSRSLGEAGICNKI